MRVISVKKLRDFYRDPANPKAEGPLLEWYAVVKKAKWEKFSDIRATYNSVDQVGSKTVFNIGGNRIRIIAVIDFVCQKLFIRFVMDHKEYDQGQWKKTASHGGPERPKPQSEDSVRTKARKSAPPDSYLRLIRRWPLRPIRSDDELAAAIDVVDSLLDRPALDRGAKDYLDVLSDLIERYETEHVPMAPVSDAQMLRHLLEAKGVSQAQTARETGIVESTISEILAGKRHRIAQIAKLRRYFHVEPAVFHYDAESN